MGNRTSASLLAALRFSRAWASRRACSVDTEVTVPEEGGRGGIRGTLYEGEAAREPRGWVVLHGMTRRGREHTELQRFARALTSTGATVLVPEIREWIELEFAPRRAQEVLGAAVRWLDARPRIRRGGVMVAGFSFGAPQALLAASSPGLAGKLRGVVAWGGFADLDRTFHFAFQGEHDWEGVTYRQAPDPYVRWVIGSNCLPLSSSLDPRGRVADALHRLAVEAGEKRIQPGERSAHLLEERLAAALVAEDRALFEVFAPPGGAIPEQDYARRVVDELIPLAREGIPLLDPLPALGPVPVPVRLLHSRTDRLIPFTESLRMGRALASTTPDLRVKVTGLIGHAGEDTTGGRIVARLWENLGFLNALRSVFEIV